MGAGTRACRWPQRGNPPKVTANAGSQTLLGTLLTPPIIQIKIKIPPNRYSHGPRAAVAMWHIHSSCSRSASCGCRTALSSPSLRSAPLNKRSALDVHRHANSPRSIPPGSSESTKPTRSQVPRVQPWSRSRQLYVALNDPPWRQQCPSALQIIRGLPETTRATRLHCPCTRSARTLTLAC